MIGRGDCVIVLCALALMAGLYLGLWTPAGHGTEVSIWVAGEERHRLPLNEDRLLDVTGAIGISTVEVRDGRVRVLKSPGPYQVCMRAGWLRDSGESAVCLPNQVVVQVTGPNPRFDSINF